MTYVDGFVVPVPKDKIDAYRKMSEEAGKVWKKHGALSYKECVGDDLEDKGFCATFPKAFDLKEGEVPIFAYIEYQSREHRDEVNAKVMAELKCDDISEMPFDCKRMVFGGFQAIVDM